MPSHTESKFQKASLNDDNTIQICLKLRAKTNWRICHLHRAFSASCSFLTTFLCISVKCNIQQRRQKKKKTLVEGLAVHTAKPGWSADCHSLFFFIETSGHLLLCQLPSPSFLSSPHCTASQRFQLKMILFLPKTSIQSDLLFGMRHRHQRMTAMARKQW